MLDAIARSLNSNRSWQDDLADLYRSLFARSENAAIQANQQAREVYDAATHELERLSRQAGAGLAEADRQTRRRARRYVGEASRRLDAYENVVSAKVRSEPLKALAVAAAAGIIIGLLTSRN